MRYEGKCVVATNDGGYSPCIAFILTTFNVILSPILDPVLLPFDRQQTILFRT
jgi:hypothetical protein